MEGGVGQYRVMRDGEVIAESNEVYPMIINLKRLEVSSLFLMGKYESWLV